MDNTDAGLVLSVINPIRTTYDDVKKTFAYTNDKMGPILRRAVTSGLLKDVVFDSKPTPLESPRADLSTGKITLHENFLSYLWTISYFMVGLFDLHHEKAKENKSVVTLSDMPAFANLNLTFAWGRSLKDEHSTWPTEVAKPTDDTLYVKQANLLFNTAVRFIMYHELAHLVLHTDALPFLLEVRSAGYERSTEDRRRLYNMERQADDFALECLLDKDDAEERKYIKYLGSAVALLSMFYLLDVADTRGGTHPDLDVRLRTLIKSIDLTEEIYKMYMQVTLSIGIQLFMTLTYTPYLPPNFEEVNYRDFDELQEHLFGIIDSLKCKANAFKQR